MKYAVDMKRDQLEDIVDWLQSILYSDYDEDENPIWDPRKRWGGDTLEQLGYLATQSGLAPKKELPRPE